MLKAPIQISYFSDVLCVWAYVAQIRLEALKEKFAEQVRITPYHVTLFGDTYTRIELGWQDKGGFDGFGKHVQEVCSQFPHVEINSNVWRTCRPTTSGNAHLFLKSIQLLAENPESNFKGERDEMTLVKDIEWDIRLAFFRDARDISDMDVLFEIAYQHNVSKDSIVKYLNNGQAMALFSSELLMKESFKLEGSPTYLLNENRQKLFGNVGYKIMEANVAELIVDDNLEQASWC